MQTKDTLQSFQTGGNSAFYEESRDRFDSFFPSEQWAIETAAHDGAAVLEIGCNRGGLRAALDEKHRGIRYTGMDGDAAVIDAARKLHPQGEFLADFFPSPKLDGRTFDSVFLFGVFYHVDAWRPFLTELAARARRYIAIDLSMTWDFPTVADMDVSYQYYFDSGTRVPRTVINVLEFVNFCFTEKVGAAKVEFRGTRPKADGTMTAVPLEKQLRGVAIVTKDASGLPILGGLTLQNDPEILRGLDLTRYRIPEASMTIDGVRTQIYPRPVTR